MAISSDEALGDRIGRLEADPAISLAAVDLTIVHPDRLRLQFDEVFYYFALVEGEITQREENTQKMRISKARFPVIKTLDGFEFSAIPSLNKALVLELSRGGYIEKKVLQQILANRPSFWGRQE